MLPKLGLTGSIGAEMTDWSKNEIGTTIDLPKVYYFFFWEEHHKKYQNFLLVFYKDFKTSGAYKFHCKAKIEVTYRYTLW